MRAMQIELSERFDCLSTEGHRRLPHGTHNLWLSRLGTL